VVTGKSEFARERIAHEPLVQQHLADGEQVEDVIAVLVTDEDRGER
jgi:hypothetical protein